VNQQLLVLVYIGIALMPLMNLILIVRKWGKKESNVVAQEQARFKKWIAWVLVIYFGILFVPIPFGEADELGLFLFYFFILFAMSSMCWSAAYASIFKESNDN
jgi:hypothetical protein